MLKKIIFLAVISLVIATFSVAMAQDATNTTENATDTQEEIITAQDLGVNEPTLLPDSKFYFLKEWKNTIQSIFTFGQVKKAELNLKIASTRLLEAEKLAEKTNNPQILEKATELYNKQVEKINANIDKFKGTATSSEAISKFLDKYTKQQILHTQMLDKLEGKVPTSTMERIKENTEKHLEKFGQVMQKLEDKNQIQERLQTALNGLKNTDLKEIKNLEILQQIKERFPSSTQQQVQQTIEQGLMQLREKLQLMPLKDQEKVSNYLEKAQGTIEKKMEIINSVKNALPSGSAIMQKIQAVKEKLQGNTSDVAPQIVGGDKDEHGCIGSAGYSWCEIKQKCLRTWEESCQTEQEQNQGTIQNQEQNQNKVQSQQGQ
ncbi:MAG: DUF5667 domain-containing protein [Candidatus Pacebacteria bacterium]|nr:DUF5667 domain-containing protein [Candidatus Paceibacterota bacterium]